MPLSPPPLYGLPPKDATPEQIDAHWAEETRRLHEWADRQHRVRLSGMMTGAALGIVAAGLSLLLHAWGWC